MRRIIGGYRNIEMDFENADYNGYSLMKFVKKEDYLEEFLSGTLYFNTSDFFSKCDEQGRGDWNEGNDLVFNTMDPGLQSMRHVFVDGKLAIALYDYSDHPEDYKPSTVFDYSFAENRNRKLISFYTIYANTDDNVIKPFPDNIEKEFGEYCVLLTDCREFCKRVRETLKTFPEFKDIRMGFVQYIDMKQGINRWDPFKKEKAKFEYQNEFRITFISSDDQPVKLNLSKPLNDIAVPVLARDLERMKVEKGHLLYPLYK